MTILRFLRSIMIVILRLSLTSIPLAFAFEGPLPDRSPIECGDVTLSWSTLEEDCANACTNGEYQAGIYKVGPTEDDPIVYLNMDCNCTKSPFYNCRDTYEVWDTSVHDGSKVCSDDQFNITSITKCRNFCSKITPGAFSANPFANGEIQCKCGDGIPVCGSGAYKPELLRASFVAPATILSVALISVVSSMLV